MQRDPNAICRCCGKPKNAHRCGTGQVGTRSVSKLCEQCGESFYADKGELKRGAAKYCSKRCYGDAKNGEGLARFWDRLEKLPSGCWEWTGPRLPQGYGTLTLYGKSARASKVAWELTNGPITDGLWVLHKCDNPPCCNPDHLFLGTRRDNVDDMLAKGRGVHGERVPGARLTADAVREVRQRIASGENDAQIARSYDLNTETIRQIRIGVTWRHVR